MKVRSRHSSKTRRRLLQVTLVTLFFVVLVLLAPRVMSGVAATVMYPIHATNTWLAESSSLLPSFFRDRQALVEEIEQLENDLVVANRTNVTLRRLSEENFRLRKLLSANEDTRVLAAVLARPSELPYDLIQIDRGTQQGVEVGAPVYIGSDVVIGLVVHTAPQYSFVELVTTPGFEATAFISGPDVVARIEGYGGGVARVRVPQGIPLSVGNLVYLPSVNPGVYGRISFIENEPTQPEQYGYISPEIALSGIHEVAVGRVSQISRSPEEIDERILEQMRTTLQVEGVSVGQIPTSTGTTTDTTASSTISDEQ